MAVAVFRLGRMAYRDCLALQVGLRDARIADAVAGRPSRARDALLFVEHAPVYTLGRASDAGNLRFDPEAPGAPQVERVARGGEVTHHAPGQLVAYPVLDLNGFGRDLHWYSRALEEVVIRALAPLGVRGEREEGLTGVWVGGEKVAAIGIGVSRWITTHGLAINVTTDLAGFDQIVPCGIEDRAVTSLKKLGAPGPLVLDAVRPRVESAFADVFGVKLELGGGVAELQREISGGQ